MRRADSRETAFPLVMNMSWMTFRPDLIVETTMACDRRCDGCYAPTTFTFRSAAPSAGQLSVNALEAAIAGLWPKFRHAPLVIAIRGGEPTLNQRLPNLIAVLHTVSPCLYLETNGHWISKDEALLDVCASFGVIVKISFDSMHNMRPDELRRACQILGARGIEWCVAITEETRSEAEETLTRCPWVARDKAIFQPKAFDEGDLLSASIGVIRPDGTVTAGLSTRPEFLSPSRSVSGRSQ